MSHCTQLICMSCEKFEMVLYTEGMGSAPQKHDTGMHSTYSQKPLLYSTLTFPQKFLLTFLEVEESNYKNFYFVPSLLLSFFSLMPCCLDFNA